MTKSDEQDFQHRSDADQTPDLADADREMDREFGHMQSREQRQAVAALFQSNGVELGQTALDAARTRGP